MALLIVYMLGTLGVSFLCSLLESVLMSTDLLHHDEEGARVQACGEVP